MTHSLSQRSTALVTHTAACKGPTWPQLCIYMYSVCTQRHKMLARFESSAHNPQRQYSKSRGENPHLKCCILSSSTFLLLHQTSEVSCFVSVQVFRLSLSYANKVLLHAESFLAEFFIFLFFYVLNWQPCHCTTVRTMTLNALETLGGLVFLYLTIHQIHQMSGYPLIQRDDRPAEDEERYPAWHAAGKIGQPLCCVCLLPLRRWGGKRA